MAAAAVFSVASLPAPAHAQAFDGGATETLQSIYIPPLVNAPFTAVVHTEWTRPIPGGGTYTVVNQRRVARDAQGRIYEERWLLVPKDGEYASKMNVIQIADPIAHTLYNCFVFQRRCALQSYGESPMTAYHPPSVGNHPIQDGKGYTTHLDLGTRTLQGLDTQGSRDTSTLLPGTFGNTRPLVTTREFWIAPQIGVNLLSIVDGPRIGRQTFTLTDVSLDAPEPQLFELPGGYAVIDRRTH